MGVFEKGHANLFRTAYRHMTTISYITVDVVSGKRLHKYFL